MVGLKAEVASFAERLNAITARIVASSHHCSEPTPL